MFLAGVSADSDGAQAPADGVNGRTGVGPVLQVRQLSKTFGGERALHDAHLTVEPGEVHGLLGENGSGKSTLIKILAGYHSPDPGSEITVNGEHVDLPLAPGEFRRLGMSFVHQDLGLIGGVSVLENLWIGTLSSSSALKVPWRQLRKRATEAFERFGVPLEPDRLVDELDPTGKAVLALVRAAEEMRAVTERSDSDLYGLLILDEPTVFLPRDGVDRLFRLVRDIVGERASVLFVSHDLDEVREVTDRVTVLRNGRVQGTLVTDQASVNDLVELIIGRRLIEKPPAQRLREDSALDVNVAGLQGGAVTGVSFDCRHGEIVGLTGLPGSGFDEVLYLLFGANDAVAGEVTIDGTPRLLRGLKPHQAVKMGIGLLPADRRADGSVGPLSVGDNLMLQVLDQYRGPVGLKRRLNRAAGKALQDFDVRPSDPRVSYQSLSGGNQQKALLAKWLPSNPRLLLLHEPTQGVDVGARGEIIEILRAAARDQTAVVCSSTDYEQLTKMCDRVLIMGRGRITDELRGEDLTKDRIANAVYDAATTTRAHTAGEEDGDPNQD